MVKGIGALIEGIPGGAGLKSIREVGELLTRFRRRESAEAIGSEILEIGQLAISGMRRTTGSDDPENGERFGHGWSGFNGVGGSLKAIVPDDSWDGSGSDAYTEQNTGQRIRSETMAGADQVVHGVLAREAYQIGYHRNMLDGQSSFLGDLSYVTFPLQFIPRYGEAAKEAIELTAVSGALQVCALELQQLHSEVNQNAAELQQAVGRYAGVADGAELADVDFGPAPPPLGSGAPTRSEAEPAGAVRPASRSVPPPALGSATPGGRVPAAEISTADQPAPTEPDPAPFTQTPVLSSGGTVGSIPSLLDAPMAPLGGLVTSAQPGQRAATARQSAVEKDAKDKAENETSDEDGEKAETDQDERAAAHEALGDGDGRRAPIHIEMDIDPDRLDAPVTVRLGPGDPSGPRAATTPSESNNGERGADVG